MGVEAEDQEVSSQPEEETRDSKSPDKEQILSEEAEKQESIKDEADGDVQQDSVIEEREIEEETENQKSPKLKLWNRLFKRGKKLKIQESDPQDAEAGMELLVQTKSVDIQNMTNNKDDVEVKKTGSGTDVTVAVTDDQDGTMEDDAEKGRKKVEQARVLRKQLLFGGIFLLFVVVAITLASVLGNSSGSESKIERTPPVAYIDCGPVQGVIEHGVYVFRGIPYAVPPVGERRWKPSELISRLTDCWSDVYNAETPASYCPQVPIHGYNFSEDCLYLNVVTPDISASHQRPVIVYLPGDSLLGYTEEDINWKPHPSLAKEKGVIFVTFNYRTNVFGFLSLDIFMDKNRIPISGNYGLHDQLAALKWVQRNIQQFGGNPQKVTLFAHGSGAAAAIALLSSKKSHELINRVWLTGLPAKFTNRSLSEINNRNSVFLKNVNCNNISCLLNRTEEEIVSSVPDFWDQSIIADLPKDEEQEESSGVPLIVPDGMLLYESIQNMWQEGEINQVPIVFGSTAQELGGLIQVPDINSWNWTEFSDYVTGKLETTELNLTQLLEFYIQEDSNPQLQFATMVSDLRVTCPIHHLVRKLSEYESNDLYTYIVNYTPSAPLKWTDEMKEAQMAVHGMDVVAIFGLLKNYIELSPEDKRFQSLIQEIFYNFVRNGEPYANGSPLKSEGYVNTIGNAMISHTAPYSNCLIWMSDDMDYKYSQTN